MKKATIIFALIILSFSAFCQSKKTAKPLPAKQDTTAPKPANTGLVVTLQPQEWEVVFTVINQSSAPHTQVAAVQGAIMQQLQPQVEKLQGKPPVKPAE